MLGRSHTLMAACGSAVALQPVGAAIGHPLAPGQLAAVIGVSAGAALLPDLDHPSASASRSLGVVTRVLARGISAVSGGHRHLTHALVFPVVAFGLAYALLAIHPAAAGVLIGICFALALKVTVGKGHPLAYLVIAIAAAVLVVRDVPLGWWLPAAVGIGCLEHVLSDVLTESGCPLLLPISRRRFRVPLISRTGNLVEVSIVAVATLVLALLCWHDFSPSFAHQVAHAVGSSGTR